MKIRYLPLLLLFLTSHSVHTLQCYNDCIIENLADEADPLFYSYTTYELLDSTCQVQTCEEPYQSEDVYCAATRLSADHAVGDDENVEFVDLYFCLHLDSNTSEDDREEEACLHGGAELGEHCNVTSLCQEDGCNAPPPDLPAPTSCYTCELTADQVCQSVDVAKLCDLVNCTTRVSQCVARFNSGSCNVSLGCVNPDIVAGCEDGSDTCSVCSEHNCTGYLPEDVCGKECMHIDCPTCSYSACEGDPNEIPESCQNQNCSAGVTECYTQINSCQITRGCKPESFSCNEDSGLCSVCKNDTSCLLNTSGICEKGGECGPSHQCVTCSHPVCADQPDSCSLQDCGGGVQQCYTRVGGCSVTRGCKTSDVTCEGDGTCKVCQGEECDLPDQSVCDSGGECEEKIVCNICNLTVSDIEESKDLSDKAIKECSESNTCSKDAKGCTAFVEKDGCELIVGCQNDAKIDAIFSKTISGSFSDLFAFLDKFPKEAESIINDCKNSAGSVTGASGIKLSFYFYYIVPLLYVINWIQ